MYLDNSATTQVSEEVFEEMKPYFREEFGNPSTLYKYGRESKKALELARQRVADAINAKPEEIIFTGGGSESDNLAIKGIAKNAAVTVKESDQDAKNYKTEITSTGSLDSKDETARTADLHMDTDRDVTYTNTSSTENVTPTGIVRMVAPYLMIVVMALLLAVVFFRSKKTETID